MLSFFRVAASALLVSCGSAGAGGTLQVSTWGGAYGEIYAEKILQPFTEKAGIEVQQRFGHTQADVVELGLHEAIHRCDDGELMYLPPDLFANIDNAKEDFVPNALQPCAVGQLVWSTVVVFAGINVDGNDLQPERVDDFFNTDVFPGRRAIKKSPRALVEWAIASAGIPPDRIYEVLSDAESAWELIEKQLGRIEDHVVWVDSDEQALRYLESGIAAFASVSSSALMREALGGAPPTVIWDSALHEMSLVAIPSATENADLSLRFLQHLVGKNYLPVVSAELGLGTARYSTTGQLNNSYFSYLPDLGENSGTSIWLNSKWWRSNAEMVISKFLDWSEKVDSLQSLAMVSPASLVVNAEQTVSLP